MAAVFGGLQSDAYDRQYGDAYLFKRIGNYLAAHKRLVVLGLLGFLVVGMARALRPVFISAAVDDLVGAGGALNFILFVLSLIAISEYVCTYGRRRFTVVVIGRIVARMRKDCFEAAIERDLAFYDRHKSGAVISRITSDTQEFGDVMLLGSEVISQFLSVTILFAALLSYSLEMTVVLLFTMPLSCIRRARLSLSGADRYAPGLTRHGDCQRQYTGERHRHQRRQEFPSGRDDL